MQKALRLLFERYETHASRYAVFDMPVSSLHDLVMPLAYKHVKPNYHSWLALRWAGGFFAYDRPVVWVYLINNRTKSDVGRRHDSRGFWVTITTVDDHALYADWKEPLDDEAIARVIKYFDGRMALKRVDKTMADLNSVIGIDATNYETS